MSARLLPGDRNRGERLAIADARYVGIETVLIELCGADRG